MPRHLGRALLWAALAFALDQITKWLILDFVVAPPRPIEVTPFLNLRLGFNYGISFGLFRDTLDAWPELLAAFKLIVAMGLLLWAALCDDRRERIGLGLIAGGALRNALDRGRQGAVTDFIDLHYQGWHWPTFNVADIAISAGVGLMLLAAFAAAQPAPEPRT